MVSSRSVEDQRAEHRAAKVDCQGLARSAGTDEEDVNILRHSHSQPEVGHLDYYPWRYSGCKE